MQSQNYILNQYKSLYPNSTLRSISERTNIQQTRVFRILNGQEMKLSEYESFKSAINKKFTDNHPDLYFSMVEELKSLNLIQIKDIRNKISIYKKNNLIESAYFLNTKQSLQAWGYNVFYIWKYSTWKNLQYRTNI